MIKLDLFRGNVVKLSKKHAIMKLFVPKVSYATNIPQFESCFIFPCLRFNLWPIFDLSLLRSNKVEEQRRNLAFSFQNFKRSIIKDGEHED